MNIHLTPTKWKPTVVMATLWSLAALKVIIMTTSSATSKGEVSVMTNLWIFKAGKSKWQLPMQAVIKISSKSWYFCFIEDDREHKGSHHLALSKIIVLSYIFNTKLISFIFSRNDNQLNLHNIPLTLKRLGHFFQNVILFSNLVRQKCNIFYMKLVQ